VPRVERSSLSLGAGGYLVRGVVLVSYTSGLRSRQFVSLPKSNRNPTGRAPKFETHAPNVTCDVLTYSSLQGSKRALLRDVLVLQPNGGLHTGEIWVPRPVTQNIQGIDLAADLVRMNPVDLDGDHVLVGFMDNDPRLPVILGTVPHPSRDFGVDAKNTGRGTRVVADDGLLKMFKHNGAVIGVDGAGDYLIDLTRAHDGKYDSLGREPRLSGDSTTSADSQLTEDGANGNYRLRLRTGSSAFIVVETDPANPETSGNTLTLLTVEAGKVELTTALNGDGSGTPTTIKVEDGKVTIDSEDGSGDVEVLGSDMNVKTSTIELGDGASHPVIKGDDYNLAHTTMDGQVTAFYTAVTAAVSTFTAALAAPPITLEIISMPSFAAALTTMLNAISVAAVSAGTAVTSFGPAAASALSSDVVTR